VTEDKLDLSTLMPPENKKGQARLTKRDTLAIQESSQNKTKSSLKVRTDAMDMSAQRTYFSATCKHAG
jgi:hypothetical protein